MMRHRFARRFGWEAGMERWRWRSFGVALWLTALVAVAATVIELFVSRPTGGALLTARDLAYALDLHLLAALAAALGLRIVCWRAPENTFPAIALGGMLAVELGVVGVHWLTRASFMPPFYTPLGKTVAALGFGAALAAAIVLARRAGRLVRRETWMRGTRGLWGAAGIALGALILAANAALVAVHFPRPARIAVRADAAARARPDVFIILVDALRRDHVSYFGYERPTTPNIDRLLAESAVFTAASTPSTWTIPSVATLFTGLYPSSHRVTGAFNRIPAEAPVLAEHFRSYGYRTGGFVANEILSGANGFAQGFETYFPPSPPWWTYHLRTAFERLATRVRKPQSASQGWRITNEFLRWLRATPNQPHFAYIHYLDPHSPYTPPAEDLRAVAPDAPPGPSQPPLFRDHEKELRDPACRDWECLANPPTLPPEKLAGMVARYDGEIHNTDRRIGRLLDELRRTGELDRCHIVFLTDHGEEFDDHHGWYHGNSIYREVSACPMAYRPPGGIAGGRTIGRPVPAIDMIYTLCGLAGIETPPVHQGREIPELTGSAAPADSLPVLCEYPPNLFALRRGPWTLIQRGSPGDPEWRLYDLRDDPAERNDLARAYPDTLAALRGYLQGRVAELTRAGVAEISSTADPELLERLRSLGYIQ
jgi:arylsulfatase A-like enzyme